MFSPSIIEVDCAAVGRNLQVLRTIIGARTRLCCVVKANAYGLGTVRMGRALDAAGADMIAVFAPDEAETLIASDVTCPILILMPVRNFRQADHLYRAAVHQRLHLVVHDAAHARTLEQLATSLGVVLKLHVEVDTGLGRGGVDPDEALKVMRIVHASPNLQLSGVMTHCARAETDEHYTRNQMAAFEATLDRAADLITDTTIIHAANTFATVRSSDFHHRMVRVGLAWAGYGTETLAPGSFDERATNLRPLVRWTSQIAQIKRIDAGASIGYGSRWTATRPTTLGLVPVGYADGYPMGLARRDGEHRPACVGVCPVGSDQPVTYVPVVGTISMDQMMIDLTDAESAHGISVSPGTVVELISHDPAAPNHLPRLAAAAGARTHDVLCHLSPRSQYVYSALPRAGVTIEPHVGSNHHPASDRASIITSEG